MNIFKKTVYSVPVFLNNFSLYFWIIYTNLNHVRAGEDGPISGYRLDKKDWVRSDF